MRFANASILLLVMEKRNLECQSRLSTCCSCNCFTALRATLQLRRRNGIIVRVQFSNAVNFYEREGIIITKKTSESFSAIKYVSLRECGCVRRALVMAQIFHVKQRKSISQAGKWWRRMRSENRGELKVPVFYLFGFFLETAVYNIYARCRSCGYIYDTKCQKHRLAQDLASRIYITRSESLGTH